MIREMNQSLRTILGKLTIGKNADGPDVSKTGEKQFLGRAAMLLETTLSTGWNTKPTRSTRLQKARTSAPSGCPMFLQLPCLHLFASGRKLPEPRDNTPQLKHMALEPSKRAILAYDLARETTQ